MENNPEHIPASVFDWIEQYRFSSLRAAQQEEVLRHFSAEEYEALHEAVLSVKIPAQASSRGREQIREELLGHFDARHSKTEKRLYPFTRPVFLWKAAALFLLCTSGWLCYEFMNHYKPQTSSFVSYTDTVYITKEVRQEPMKVYDTVYIKQEISASEKKASHESPGWHRLKAGRKTELRQEDLHVLSIRDYETVPNALKRNSVKDDSLIRKFKFVTL